MYTYLNFYAERSFCSNKLVNIFVQNSYNSPYPKKDLYDVMSSKNIKKFKSQMSK